ncbi:hypothetical protein N0K71_07585 [Dellaglioa algida]|uniref:Lipoprotein n=1 Tax=Dellaglioa algida DSM 15638 TaxID=1423719 RepID=A0A0R1HI29_9LACO|nr:hypothetical protein [Dellaglioa algida]KRK45113.1 hypothetical protein FC66_GL000516 [Dellaglioa algida DSM 15638]MDK1733483.1 hypothetical protein [Dellaglioa algida]MDK1735000.1 hypothetical protein [Dellaglioa algida]
MKKTAYLLGILIISASLLTACGNNSKTISNKNETSTHYVSGVTKKVGDTQKATDDAGQAKLLAIKNINLTKNIKGTTFKFKDAKILEIKTNNKSQRDTDEKNFGVTLPDTYYEFALYYDLTNNNKTALQINTPELILPNKVQVQPNQGSMDSLVGETIQAGAKKEGMVGAIVEKTDVSKISKFKYVTSNMSSDDDSININATTFELNK